MIEYFYFLRKAVYLDMFRKTGFRYAVIFIVLLSLFILPYGYFSRPPAAAEVRTEHPAENLIPSAKLRLSSGADPGPAADGQISTVLSLEAGDTIRIETERPAEALYVIWDDLPGPWTLTEGGRRLPCGRNAVLHEYIPLSGTQNEFFLELPPGSAVCEIALYTEGRLPDSVQIWEPPCAQADLLLFPTHGDDEHLFFGGIMPYYAGELGLKVQVAYLTNHKYTEKHRVHEILDGLWTVGIRAYPVFSEFPDVYAGSLEEAERIYEKEAVAAWQVETIRRFRPSVIVGHDFDGEYGHGAHMLNARMLAEAVPAAADAAQYPESAAEYGAWNTPKLYIHLYEENTLYMDWENLKLSSFGGRTALEMAREGYRCHLSQQHWSFAVRTDGYGDCRCFGLYRSTVGADVRKDDLFENIRLEPAQTPEPTLEPTAEPTAVPTAAASPCPEFSSAEQESTPSARTSAVNAAAETRGSTNPQRLSGAAAPGALCLSGALCTARAVRRTKRR